MAKIIYVDFEAGSVDPQRCGITQMSIQIEIDYVLVATANWFIRPHEGDEITLKACEIQGISPADLLTDKYRPYEEVFPQLEAFLGQWVDRYNSLDKFIFSGYNARFDEEVMRRFFKQNNNNFFGSWFWSGPLDVMAIAAQVYMNHRHNLTSFSLGSLLKVYSIINEEGQLMDEHGQPAGPAQLHDSRVDIDGTRRLHHKLISKPMPTIGQWPVFPEYQLLFVEPTPHVKNAVPGTPPTV